MRRFVFLLAVTLLAGSCRSHRDPARTKPNPPAPERAKVPPISIIVDYRDTNSAILTLVFLPDWERPAEVGTSYYVSWSVNGTPVAAEQPAMRVLASLWFPDGDHYTDQATTETWRVTVTASNFLGSGETATAETTISLSLDCRSSVGYWHPWFVDCDRDYEFLAPITTAAPSDPAKMESFLFSQAQAHFLQPSSPQTLEKARNFFNLAAMRLYSDDPNVSFIFDKQSFAYRSGYNPKMILDRHCLDVPLVGSYCLHGYAADVDNEPSGRVYSYAATEVAFLVNRRNGEWWLTVEFVRAEVDLVLEPPTDATLTDITFDVYPDYIAADDLSAYIKAFGRASGKFRAELTVDLTQSGVLGYQLRDFYQLNELHPVLQKGPYCNNNLGTVAPKGAVATAFYPHPVTPPNAFPLGAPLYPGLVSDTSSYGVMATYYARTQPPYPHAASSSAGGSGAGRDAIGLNAFAYEYDDAMGRHSDNPNNCRRPADACTVADVQDGGVAWAGVSQSCEYPNTSNDSDDSTFKMTEIVMSAAPLICLGTCPSVAKEVDRALND